MSDFGALRTSTSTRRCVAAFHRKDSTPRYGRRLPRCGISIQPMSQLGHSLQVRPRPLVHKCPLCIDTDRKFWVWDLSRGARTGRFPSVRKMGQSTDLQAVVTSIDFRFYWGAGSMSLASEEVSMSID